MSRPPFKMSVRSKLLLSVSKENKILENMGSPLDYYHELQQPALAAVQVQDEGPDYLRNCPAEVNIMSPKVYHDLQLAELPALAPQTIPELHKEDLLGLSTSTSPLMGINLEDLDIHDFDENVILDLTVKKNTNENVQGYSTSTPKKIFEKATTSLEISSIRSFSETVEELVEQLSNESSEKLPLKRHSSEGTNKISKRKKYELIAGNTNQLTERQEKVQTKNKTKKVEIHRDQIICTTRAQSGIAEIIQSPSTSSQKFEGSTQQSNIQQMSSTQTKTINQTNNEESSTQSTSSGHILIENSKKNKKSPSQNTSKDSSKNTTQSSKQTSQNISSNIKQKNKKSPSQNTSKNSDQDTTQSSKQTSQNISSNSNQKNKKSLSLSTSKNSSKNTTGSSKQISQNVSNNSKQKTKNKSRQSLNSTNNSSQNSNKQTSKNDSNNLTQKSKKRRIRNEAKRLIIEKKKYTLKPPCSESCRKTCSRKFSEKERFEIWSNFRDLSKQSQRNFISRNVKKINKKTCTNQRSSRRHNTFTWSLKYIKVCKTFFLNTLGFKNDQTVVTILKANYKCGIKDVDIQEAAPEQRGRTKRPWNAFDEGYRDNVKLFIEQIKPTVSHYNLKHAPNRRYLPCGVSFRDLFKAYQSHCEENQIKTCSWTYFHRILKNMNLSTANPRQDFCTTCQRHKEKHTVAGEVHNCDNCDCELCKTFPVHIKHKIESRQSLEKDLENSNETSKVFTADLQKAICMPKLTVKDYYFSRKLVLFNETFVSPGQNEPAYCIIWHEGESGRKAHNIASAYVHFILEYARDLTEIIFYCDNCTSQNKNRTLFSAMIRLINSSSSLLSAEKVRFVYLEPGHTYMAADTVHGCIATKFNKVKEIYDLKDYRDKINKSRKLMTVKAINHEHMIQFKDELKKTFPKNYNISSLKIAEFRRGSKNIFVKRTYNEEFKELNVSKKNLLEIANDNLIRSLPRETTPRGISSMKKQDLLKLIDCMPQSRRKFFEDLQVNEESPDLDSVSSD